MNGKKVNIRTVAVECGVSKATVSRVLNHNQKVNPELRKRVIEVIRKYNYNPFDNLPSLKKAKLKSIRAIVPYTEQTRILANPFYAKGISGMQHACFEKGYDFVMSNEQGFDQMESDPTLVNQLLNSSDAFVLFCPGRNQDRLIRRLKAHNAPVGLVNRRTTVPGVVTVTEKRKQGVHAMLLHLKTLGYRDIGFGNVNKTIIPNIDYAQEACGDLGLAFNPDRVCWFDYKEGLRVENWLKRLHQEGKMPEALFIFDDVIAIEAIGMLQALGYKVGGEVAVVGYDNIEQAGFVRPGLTTMNSPIDRMAAFAVRQLADQAETGRCEGVEIQFEPELVVRESCGVKAGNISH